MLTGLILFQTFLLPVSLWDASCYSAQCPCMGVSAVFDYYDLEKGWLSP